MNHQWKNEAAKQQAASRRARHTWRQGRACIYLRSPTSPRGWSPRTSCQGCLDRHPGSPRSSGGSRCGHRLGAEPVTPGRTEDPHPGVSGGQIAPPTTRPGPSLQKLVQPRLIACFLAANRVHSDRRAGSGGPGNLLTPQGCRGAGRLTLVPASQQAKQVVAGLLQQHVVVAFVRAVGVVVVSEVAQTVHCKGACSSLGVRRERCPHPLPPGTLRSGPRPSLTGQSISHPLQAQLRPQPAVRPIHLAAPPSRIHWEHPQGSRDALHCSQEAPTATSIPLPS